MSGSGISWAICKSAPRSRQITTPAPTTQIFTGRLPFLPPNQHRQSTEGMMLDLLTVGLQFSPPAYRAAAAAIGLYRPAPDLSSKPTGRRCCCRSTGQADRRTNGRTRDRFRTLTHTMQTALQSINQRLFTKSRARLIIE